MYKYEEVIQDLHEKLIYGIWKEEQSLPSIRQLADHYKCSKSTIIRAYTELEQQHLIYAIPQSGYYVVKHENQKLENTNPVIDFASSALDPTLFPYRDFKHCLNQAINRYQDELFQYGTPQGLPSLIDVLQKQLADHQVFASREQFVITSGVQRALSILTMMPFPNGKEIIMIEQPGYHLFIEMLELLQKPVIGIPRTKDGLDLDLVEQLFRTKPIKFFYTMPRFQNPLGTSYSQEEKKTLAKLAKRYDVYIVEDDYLLDLEMDSKADPIFAVQNDQTIYLKSFSKVLFPGLRVGVTILPTHLIPLFRRYKRTQDIDSSMLSQAGLGIYIKNGMYNYHLKKIRSTYSKRMKIMLELLLSMDMESYITFPTTLTGSHTHLLLNRPVSVTKLQQMMKKQHIILSSSDPNYLHDHPKERLVQVKISNVPTEKITTGLTAILRTIKKMSNLNDRQFF